GGDEVIATDELVELHQVRMLGLDGLRGMQDHEQVIRIGVDLWQMASIEHVAQRQPVEAEEVAQALCPRLVALDQVDPYEAFRSRQQALDIGPAMLFNARRRNPANLGGTAVDRLNRARLGSLHGHGLASIRRAVPDLR